MRHRCLTVLIVSAAWLGFAQPGSAQGTIAYYQPPSPIVLRDEFFGQFYHLDLDDNGNPDVVFAYNLQFIGVGYPAGTRALSLMYPFPDRQGVPQPLPERFLIGPDSGAGQLQWFGGVADAPAGFYALAWFTSAGAAGQFVGQQAYMGVEFQRASGTHYGWVSLYVDRFAPVAVIDSWAWETRPGVPILAGAVPEPSTLALLVGGGLLIVWFKLRRNERMG
jgi:hypothetical protein